MSQNLERWQPAARAPGAPAKPPVDPDAPRRRLACLFDDGEFHELDARVRSSVRLGRVPDRAGDGVVVATGKLHGRPSVAFAQDRSFLGGSVGEAHAAKVCKAMDWAERLSAPLVGLIDSGGARIQEGVAALAGYGQIFRRNVALSGRVPQISVGLGPCAGGAVYSPAITDFLILSEPDALFFVTGPKIVREVLREDVDARSLGGARVHSEKSGVAHLVRGTELEAIAAARELLHFLVEPHRHAFEAPAEPRVGECVPADFRKPYDVRAVLRGIADRGSFLEIQPDYARNIVVALARIEGASVGLIANQPKHRAGVIDISASRKAARFVRTMSCFGLPIVSFVDTPGFMPGRQQEHEGIITHGAKLLYAYCEARVPRLAVVLRKAFGGAYIVMSSKHIGSDLNLAWPDAQIAVMGAESAVEILHATELRGAADPHRRREELLWRYRARHLSVKTASERGWIDDVVRPEATRAALSHYLDLVSSGGRKPHATHGNIPL